LAHRRAGDPAIALETRDSVLTAQRSVRIGVSASQEEAR
jgi:hypothetical protein